MPRQFLLSVTAHIDLLGFTQHLSSGSGDFRTDIGRSARRRLHNLEIARRLIRKEFQKFKELLPAVGSVQVERINDSLILSLDASPSLLPKIGSTRATFDYERADRLVKRRDPERKLPPEERFRRFHDLAGGREALTVAKFVALVARTHMYINNAERMLHFPGCRTIVAAGIRYNMGLKKADVLSANLALAVAYMASLVGRSGGIGGNRMYLEDGVAQLIAQHHFAQRLLYYCQFVPMLESGVYGQSEFLRNRTSFKRKEPVLVRVFENERVFREVNSAVASNLFMPQLLEEYLWRSNPKMPSDLSTAFVEGIKGPLLSYEEINGPEPISIKRPVFFFDWKLGENLRRIVTA